MTRRIRRPQTNGSAPPPGRAVRDIPLPEEIGEADELSAELEGYVDVLLGRVDPPLDAGELTLFEVADAYYARAKEMEMAILKAERSGAAFRGSKLYRFRTGELRAFQELAKRAADLGSRRLAQAELEFQMSREGQGLLWSHES